MRVNTDELTRQAYQLRSVANRLNDIQDSVLRIARNLSRESVGERFYPSLRQAANAIGERSDDLRKMRAALSQISRLYEKSEGQIIDEAQHAAVHYEQRPTGVISIPRIIIDPIPRPTPVPIPTPWFDRERISEIFDRIYYNDGPGVRIPSASSDIYGDDIMIVGPGGTPSFEPGELISTLFPEAESTIPAAFGDGNFTPDIQRGRGLNPVPEIQIPEPIDVSEVFPSGEINSGLNVAPNMEEVIRRVTQVVGPGATAADIVADIDSGSSGASDIISNVIGGSVEPIASVSTGGITGTAPSGISASLDGGITSAIDWTPWNP